MEDMQPVTAAGLRAERIIEAGTDVFCRYGYARATMGDIAEGAGISRPALYLVFPSKEEIFAAVIGRMSEQSQRELRQALPGLNGLRSQLHYCCERWGVHGYDLMQAHPAARDLFNISVAPVRKMYGVFAELVAELIAPAAAEAEWIEATPAELARNLIFAMRGFKEAAKDGADMRRMIALQVDMLCSALETRPG